MANSAHLKCIGFNVSAKFYYQANNDNIKNEHISTHTDMVADISCIPSENNRFYI